MFPFKDNLRCIIRPTATAVLIIINCVFFVIEEALLHSGQSSAALVETFGTFIPANFTHAFSSADPLPMLLTTLSIFTAMFLHSGTMHIFGNMVFLNCFGRAVEARLGKKQYIAFYLLAGIAATAGQYLTNPWSPGHCLGASGAIAGVLSAYLIFFPKAKIAGISLEVGILYSPVWSYLLSWVAIQIVSIIFEPAHQGGGVAYMEHIGGFAFGVMAGVFAMCLSPVNDVRYADGSPTRKRFSVDDLRSLLRRMSIVLSPIRRLIGFCRRICSGCRKLIFRRKQSRTAVCKRTLNGDSD